MAPRASLLLALLACGSLLLASAQQVKCPPPNFDSVKNLNMTAYMSKTWYVNMQVRSVGAWGVCVLAAPPLFVSRAHWCSALEF